MLSEKFETWSANSITKETLVKLDLQINTLGYLEEGLHCFIELPDNSNKKNRQMIGLKTTAAIPNND